MPVTLIESIAYIIFMIVAGICISVGLGAGLVKIPIFILMLNYTNQEATYY